MIKIENLSHQIGGKPILSGINADIPRAGITALIGPNGAGKSTLLSLIARLERIQLGTVHVDDLQIGQCSDRELAQRLSILPQMPDQPLRLTVRELVNFGRHPYHAGRPSAADHAKVKEAIEVLGIEDLADRSLETLSGGQRQRAQIAMIFAQDTTYMLLDEPLNNLDLAGSRTLMRILRRVSDDHGKTIVIVVHDINIASRYADRVVAMKGGRIARQGSPIEVIDAALIRDVFETDAELIEIDGGRIVLS
ncbi:iron ABC transporter ATP-binding protein [Candidatus Rhodobacter oscarellae]|uniref:iron ABC transporter ATP-binding protein n=1 Tax=Candidatus Rhodobacter oscarellae TaxID=1675527 RepID=UPI000670ACA7|nr:ATP-binding cassette domain-containing protein [Candidatus Rhodobacter lobularis]